VSRWVVWRRRAAAILGLALVAAAVWVIAQGRLPWQPDKHGAEVHTVRIASKAVGKTLDSPVVVPAAALAHPPLLVFLHGRGGHAEQELTTPMYAALAGVGKRAPVVVFVGGGPASYWHDRHGGDWGDYVFSEVIPEVEREFHTDPRRVGIGGVSMGGFGALDIARLHPGFFCAVGAHSPALWAEASQTAPGAYDDPADFAAHDVVGAAQSNPQAFAFPHLWIDAGTEDPFQPWDRQFATALRSGGIHFTSHLDWPGQHGGSYWDSHWDDYMRFYAASLSHCPPA
jgi:S-formylglutathione hydrolase FrmB